MEAIAQLMPKLAALGRPAGGVGSANFTLATLTHATLGQPTFGIAPGYGEVWATLRSATDTAMHRLCQDAESLAKQAADAGHLALDVSYHEVFEACVNNAEAVAALTQGFAAQQIPYQMSDVPQLWSEDFGQFAQGAKTAMFWIGSGEDQPQLHTPQYDFPDALLPMGVAAFTAVLRDMLG
jgi:metal-dependent amidase/aminoacylase/carboxypeptidase family protein